MIEIKSKIKEKIGIWLCCILMITPIAIQTLPPNPFKFHSWIAGALLFVYVFWIKDLLKGLWSLHYTSILIAIYLLINFYGFIITEGKLPALVQKELVWGVILFFSSYAVLMMFRTSDFCSRFDRVSNIIFQVFAAVVAALSILKFSMWSQDIALQWIVSSDSSYPIGSALVGDINFFSLTIFILSMTTFSVWRTSKSLVAMLLLSCLLFCLVFAGFAAGSRRFLLVGCTFLPVVLFLNYVRGQISFKELKILFIGCMLGLAIVLFLIYAVDFSRFFESGKLVNDHSFVSWGEKGNDYSFTSSYGTLMSESRAYGFDSRLIRLSFGGSMIDIKTLVMGSGFDYITTFGCEFLECLSGDYPHLPVLSGLLSSGILGGITCILLFANALHVGLKLMFQSKNQIEWGASVVVTALFASISGNTLFSIPVFFVVLIYGLCACLNSDWVERE